MFLAALLFLAVTLPCPAHISSMTVDDIAREQARLAVFTVGERIAFWAESFVGSPYDTDPLGAYVRSCQVVCDSEVDCMYHVFRSVELATSGTPKEAVDRALTLRFSTRGRLAGGKVVNYDERFQYGEDMIDSGRWGEDVTAGLGRTVRLPGSRGREYVTVLPKDELPKPGTYTKLKDGDIVYFIKDPSRRVVGEIVGHLGVIKVEGGRPALIHASGTKSREGNKGGGVVKKVDFLEYAAAMKFVGVKVTRFK